jgi:competence protein ComEC
VEGQAIVIRPVRSITATDCPRSLYLAIRDGPLMVTAVAVAMGICLDRQFALPVSFWCMWSGLSLSAWLTAMRRGRFRIAGLILLVGSLALGGLWHHCRWHLFADDDLVRFARGTTALVHVRATVHGVPRWRPGGRPSPFDTVEPRESTRMAVRVFALRCGRQWQPVSGHASLMVDGHLCEFLPGDDVQFSALLRPIAGPLNPGEPDFAAHRRQTREMCDLFCRHRGAMTLLAQAPCWHPRRILARFQLAALETLQVHAGPQAGLACAMVLGTREQLRPTVADDFLHSGTIHLLAVSGLHLGILASLLWLAMRTGMLPQRVCVCCIVALVMGYALLTGCRPPVVRAAILIIVCCAAKWLGRRAFSHNSLGAAALLTMAWSPGRLFDTGTQLSFLAVATIFVWVGRRSSGNDLDPLQQLIRQSRPLPLRAMRYLAAAVGRAYALTAIVWAVTVPLVASRFHLVAPVGVVLNPLLWFPVATALFSGFGTLLAAVVCPPLAAPLGWICQQSLAMLHQMVQAAAQVPGGHWWVCGPPTWWVTVFYLSSVLVYLVRLTRWRTWPCVAWFSWLALACLLAAPMQRFTRQYWQDELTVSFVAVGHGTCVLVEFPDGRTLLYDAGRLGSARSAVRPIAAVLWSRRIRHLDAVVLSHADADHFNALPTLLRRFSVGTVYVSPLMFASRAPAVAALQAELQAAGVPIRQLVEQRKLAGGADVAIEVWHPPPEGCNAGDNADSIVLAISYGCHRVLMPGDLESVGLDELLAEEPRRCDVLMAPHHGSRHSAPDRVLRWTAAQFVVISGGPTTDLDEVIEGYLLTGARVFHTQRSGSLTFEITRRSIRRR